MKKLAVFLSLSLMSLLLASAVFAQGFYENYSDIASIQWWWDSVFGLPAEWMRAPAIIYNFIIPFLAIFAVCLGFLRQLRIFHRVQYVEMILAFCMAFSTLPTRAFVTLVTFTLAWMGMLSYAVFILLFGVGMFWYFITRIRGWSSEAKVGAARVEAAQEITNRYKELKDREDALRQQMVNLSNQAAGNQITAEQYEKSMMQLRGALMDIENQRNNMLQRLKSLENA